MNDSGPVVIVEGLRKTYGDVRAVDGISFTVNGGEVFGIVGPNGAGKTTTMDCVVGMRRPDAGRVSVLDLDPLSNGLELRQRLGIQQQESELPDRIRIGETMELFSSFYRNVLDWRGILEELSLLDKEGSYFSELSGGQKRRLFIALALVGDPEVVFLDELTSGLDPQARRSIWELVRKLRSQGRTVVMSTHYMDEAEKLCDRVAIIDHGSIAALDTPGRLIDSLGRGIRVVFSSQEFSGEERIAGIPGISSVERDGDRVSCMVGDSDSVVSLVRALGEMHIPLDDFRTERITLEDVFLSVTGSEVRD